MAMVRELPVDERPRERLLALGPGFLSNAELLAIVLRNGSKERSALQLAQDILSLYKDDGVSALGRMTAGELMCLQGIGSAKAAEVMAAVELGKRLIVPLNRDFTRTGFVCLINNHRDELGLIKIRLNNYILTLFDINADCCDKMCVFSENCLFHFYHLYT